MNQTGIVGNHAEKLALKYLKKQGLELVEANFNCRYGELDLIMRHAEYLVFIEVRYRKSQKYGGALASIDHRKQTKLRNTAEYYMIRNKLTNTACRFDIICLDGNLGQTRCDWIQNAF